MFVMKIAATLAVTAAVTCYIACQLNRPYPWNSPTLDTVEGISVLVFLPSALTVIFQAIWLL